MSKFYNRISRSIRKRYIKIFPPAIPIPPKRDMNPEQVSRKIYEALQLCHGWADHNDTGGYEDHV